MTKDLFLEKAMSLISEDPMSRVSAKTKEALSDSNCIFDTHCHIFDRKCINSRYFLTRFFKETVGLENISTFDKDALEKEGYVYLSKTLDTIYEELEKDVTDEENDWKVIEAELEKFDKKLNALESYSFFGLWETFKVLLKGNKKAVLDYYLKDIAISRHEDLKGRHFITSILMMDLEKGWDRPISKSFIKQIDELKILAKDYLILPYLAVDPRRADESGDDNLYKLFLKAFTEGDTPFFGVKLYPSLGYLPSDERLYPIFEVCEKKNIPVLTHCGGETVSAYKKEIEVRRGTIKETWKENNRIDLAKRLNDPENWEDVLKMYPKLKLNFGHFGGDTAWSEYRANKTQKRIDKIIELMNSYENVYADFSFNIIEDNLFETFDDLLSKSDLVKERSLFGTDFWVVLPSGNLVEKQEDFLVTLDKYKEHLISRNPLKYLFDTK